MAKAKKRGPKPKPPTKLRRKALRCRASDAECRKVARDAAAEGMTVSDYIRSAIGLEKLRGE